MKSFKIILLLMLTFIFSSNDTFKIVHSDQGVSSIVFESESIDLKIENGKSTFVTHDLIGLTMDEGRPQLPTYSTLFQINPNKTSKIVSKTIGC